MQFISKTFFHTSDDNSQDHLQHVHFMEELVVSIAVAGAAVQGARDFLELICWRNYTNPKKDALDISSVFTRGLVLTREFVLATRFRS